jgi:acyl-CoA dehydrogenase
VCVVREVLMATCSHADSLFALQGIGSFAVTTGGTDAQRSRWLPAVASGQALAALALTEPVAGSDLRSITTEAVVGDDGTIELRGSKSFISNAGAASFYTVLAREGDGLSAFLVPADADGLTTRPAPELAAAHVLGDVDLDGVRLEADARLGRPGHGLDLVLATLAVFRVSVAGAAVGLAQAALEEATRHAAGREQFGRPLARLGPVAGLLADSWADVESARLITYRAAELARQDPRSHLEHSSLAKLAATEACSRVVDRCVQVMGRWGLVRDSRVERCYRQSRPMRVYEGASEVLRLGIARQLVQEVG